MPRRQLVVELEKQDGRIALICPNVGIWRSAPPEGALIAPGFRLGILEQLGVQHDLIAPKGATGVIVDQHRAPRVEYGSVLVVLDSKAAVSASAVEAEEETAQQHGLFFLAPMSGRYYSTPGPQKPPFIRVGDEVKLGQTIGLLEVMKTFNRVIYDSDTLPPSGRIRSIFPTDGDDLAAGDPIFELESDS